MKRVSLFVEFTGYDGNKRASILDDEVLVNNDNSHIEIDIKNGIHVAGMHNFEADLTKPMLVIATDVNKSICFNRVAFHGEIRFVGGYPV